MIFRNAVRRGSSHEQQARNWCSSAVRFSSNASGQTHRRTDIGYTHHNSLQLYRSKTSPPQSHLGRVRRSRTNMQQSPHWLQWDAPNSPPKLPLPVDVDYPSNTLINRLTPHTISNDIWIQSAVLPQYILDRQTHRPRDGLGDSLTPLGLTLAIVIESNAVKIKMCLKTLLALNE